MIGDKEKNIFDIVKKFTPINKVIDVGGFHGSWTEIILKSEPDCEIIIFEPELVNFEILKSKFNDNDKITLINKGASYENSNIEFHKVLGGDHLKQMSGFVDREIYKNHEVEKSIIDVMRIDSINQEVDLLKIDTEGFEYNVLMGCEKLLSQNKIKFIQFEYGGTFLDNNLYLNDIINYLSEYNYLVYDIDKMGKIFNIQNYKDDYSYNNFFATYIKII